MPPLQYTVTTKAAGGQRSTIKVTSSTTEARLKLLPGLNYELTVVGRYTDGSSTEASAPTTAA